MGSPGSLPTRILARPLAQLIVNCLVIKINLRVTPSQVTFVAFGLGISNSFFFGFKCWTDTTIKASDLLVWFVIEIICFILDCVDGQLARTTNRSSKKGAIFDIVADTISESIKAVLVIALTLKLGQDSIMGNILSLYFVLRIANGCLYLISYINTPNKLLNSPESSPQHAMIANNPRNRDFIRNYSALLAEFFQDGIILILINSILIYSINSGYEKNLFCLILLLAAIFSNAFTSFAHLRQIYK
jgi:hypothetical protein